MKNKTTMLLALITSLSLLSSCGENEKIFLSYKVNYETVESVFEEKETYEQFALACNNKTSFLAIVYSDLTCSCYVNLKTASKNYIFDNGIDLYNISNDEFIAGNDTYGYKAPSYDFPAILLVNNGVVSKQINYNSDNKVFFVRENFVAFMSQNIQLPKINKIGKEKLETIKNSNECIIYFGNSKCPDCSSYYTNVLYPFITTNYENIKNDFLYFIDKQECNFKTTEEWVQFKNENSISNVNNTEFGYGQGYVPTIQYYKNGILSSANVFLNDTIEENMLVQTYYTNERISKLSYLTGMEDSYNYFLTSGEKTKVELQNAHVQIATIFLKTYLLQ